VWFKDRHRTLHRPRRNEHFRNEVLAFLEQPPHLGHSRDQPFVEDRTGVLACIQRRVDVFLHTAVIAFHDALENCLDLIVHWSTTPLSK